MLQELRLRGFGAIDEATLPLRPGFTAVTGETGAGKTMLLTGLALLLGGRADAGLVRSGYERAEVEGRFTVDPAGPAADIATEAGAVIENDELLVVRTIGADGRSRAHLGGRSVPVSTLASLAEHLVTVHGQAEQRGLLRTATQRGVLDEYAGASVMQELTTYHQAFSRLGAVRAAIADLAAADARRSARVEELRRGLAEIDAVAPTPNEDVDLAAEARRLEHAESLRAAAATAHLAVSGQSAVDDGHDAVSLLGAARRSVETVTGHDPTLDAFGSRLAEAGYLLADLGTELASYADGIASDPARLAWVQERRAALAAVCRRYGSDVTAVLAWADQARPELHDLATAETRRDELAAERDRLLAELAAAADRLSQARTSAARRLHTAVGAELESLAMAQASLQVVVRQREDPRGLQVNDTRVAFGSSGIDDVELLLQAHPGAPARPLHRGASGGELSRVMLALELVLAASDRSQTFVFDEVDAGVGGRAAVEVGRRLAALARGVQVVVVTHLPQVAAFADHHVVVARTDDGVVTSSEVDLVDGETRVRELSRMLGGFADSDLARGHAQELLSTASHTKSGG